jgi:phosphopantothenoylcysteine decarboxylase/phosphopantothenate--cysteine ligase
MKQSSRSIEVLLSLYNVPQADQDKLKALIKAKADATLATTIREAAATDTQPLTLTLEPTPDLLAGIAKRLGARATRQTKLIGFSAESGATKRAAEKLKAKDLDLIVANDVTAPGIGFESAENRAEILDVDGGISIVGPAPKRVVADAILDRLAALLVTGGAR